MADAIVDGFRQLSASVVADTLRMMAYPSQVMDPTIQPVRDGFKLCGRAFTLANLPARVGEVNRWYDAEERFRPGDVVVSSIWGSSGINHVIGSRTRGCVGLIIDGPYRDLSETRRTIPDFPIFCRRGLPERSANPGSSHRSFHTRWMYDFNVPIACGSIRVEPGDVVLGDDDGVIVVPKNIEEDALRFAISYEKADSLVASNWNAGKGIREVDSHVKTWAKDSGLWDWLQQRGFRSILGPYYPS